MIDIFMTKTWKAEPLLSDEKTVKALVLILEKQIGLQELNTKLQGKGKIVM